MCLNISGIPASHWNTEDHLYCIEQLTESLQLPWFLNDDFEKDDWSEICEVLWIYIDKVIDDHSGQAKIDLSSKYELLSIFNQLLSHMLKNLEEVIK